MMAPDNCVIFQGVGEDQTSCPPPSGSAHAYILQCTIKGCMASNKSKETSVSTNWSEIIFIYIAVKSQFNAILLVPCVIGHQRAFPSFLKQD